MAIKIPVWFIDYLLYYYRDLCKEIESLDACQSGFAKVPPRGSRPRSPVERILVERDDLSVVVRAVGRAWRAILAAPDLREVAILKYRRGESNKRIVDLCNFSRSTLDRKLEATRGLAAGFLLKINEAKMKQMIAKIRPTHEANMLYLQRERPSGKAGKKAAKSHKPIDP